MARPQYPSLSGNKSFLALLFGRGVSSLGDYFGNLALSWLVYAITGSAFDLAITWVVFMIPRALVRLFAGVYVDKWNKKRIMFATETTRAVLFGAIGAGNLVGYTPLAFIFVVAFSVGLLGALFDLAGNTVVPFLVEKDSLLRANSTFTAVFEADSIAGPALAGITIALFGTAAALLADSLSFVVLVFALLLITVPSMPLGQMQRTWKRDFKEGFAYFKTRMDLVWMSILVMGSNFGLGALWYVYALIFSDNVLMSGSFGYGMLGTFSAAGILTSVIYLARIGRVQRRRLAILTSLFGMGAAIVALSFTTTLPEALVAIFIFGLFLPFSDTIPTVYYQQTVPGPVLGRILGFKQFVEFLTAPVSVFFGAFAASYYGVTNGILIAGVVVVGCGLIGVFARPLKKLIPLPEPQQFS
ncbi:MAG: MFS transporter [Nitrososphaerales archaeon]|jgi:MFS family permease